VGVFMMPRIGENWEEQIRALKPGWNTYGAPEVTEDAIETVKWVFVIPCNDGGIQLELHLHGVDFELIIDPSGRPRSVSFDMKR